MIKPVLKYCIPIYLILGFIAFLLIKTAHVTLSALLALLILIVIILALGLLFGLIISVLIRKPAHEGKFYWIGQALSLILVASLFTYGLVHDFNKRTKAEQNEITVQEVTDSISRPFVSRAFDSLKLKFKNPNDLDLNSVTTIQNDDGFTVYLAYNLFDNQKKEYYSRYKVNNDQAQLVQFNLDTRSTIEYMHIRRQQEALKDTLRKYEKGVK